VYRAADWGVAEDPPKPVKRATGLETGGRDERAAMRRGRYGNSAPLLMNNQRRTRSDLPDRSDLLRRLLG
jgi:hypothetical protein